jgi:hypothetical protein
MRNADRNAAYSPDWMNQCKDHKSAHTTHEDEDGVHLFKDLSLSFPVDDFGPSPVVLPSAFGFGGALIWECHSLSVPLRVGNGSPPLAGC